MILPLALTLAATASAAVVAIEAVWLPLFRSDPTETIVRESLGAPDMVEPFADGTGREFFYRKRPGFPGGVSVWFDARGRATDATFWLTPAGPLWTRASKTKATAHASPVTLDELIARYGAPAADKEGKGRRIGVRRVVYEEGGESTRSVVFASMPFSRGVHSVVLSWERR